MRVGLRNRDRTIAEAEIETRLSPVQEHRLGEPARAQIDRLTAQIEALQQRLDALIPHRSDTVAERASRHVASIVGAAEKSAAKIRAGAEHDAARFRDRLLADVRDEAERIRGEARADARRIRADARADAERARELAVVEVSAEIQAVCARLAADVESAARTAVARLSRRESAPAATPVSSAGGLTAAATSSPRGAKLEQIASDARAAVVELQTATAALEQSARQVEIQRGEEQRAATA